MWVLTGGHSTQSPSPSAFRLPKLIWKASGGTGLSSNCYNTLHCSNSPLVCQMEDLLGKNEWTQQKQKSRMNVSLAFAPMPRCVRIFTNSPYSFECILRLLLLWCAGDFLTLESREEHLLFDKHNCRGKNYHQHVRYHPPNVSRVPPHLVTNFVHVRSTVERKNDAARYGVHYQASDMRQVRWEKKLYVYQARAKLRPEHCLFDDFGTVQHFSVVEHEGYGKELETQLSEVLPKLQCSGTAYSAAFNWERPLRTVRPSFSY